MRCNVFRHGEQSECDPALGREGMGGPGSGSEAKGPTVTYHSTSCEGLLFRFEGTKK